ncbi:DUF5335 family protein [Stigmatella aurantiaca]|uniref:Conserved uncharacterized protein n=1 Tax=Stigmatella aurantiaca (strain DW4/3-1) TaxID=378806 RepID=Q099D6_STIAD|nr:DUF5335 family protein [Stigmatella aurantiaca]ADO75585.1 conserved uncharacterized protein [Stigmatella aurantiaca DW4/3-1]EAU68388.1 hypothetical protein STIAU_3927 [Stigmatella aurantiaca DW4/3-1]
MHYSREIPREGWADYLALLSSLARARRVRIDAGNTEFDEQPLSQSLPLVSIGFAEEDNAQGFIIVTVGRPGEEITHRILNPACIRADENESGDLECLAFQDAEQTRTLLFFEPSEVFLECVGSPADAS